MANGPTDDSKARDLAIGNQLQMEHHERLMLDAPEWAMQEWYSLEEDPAFQGHPTAVVCSSRRNAFLHGLLLLRAEQWQYPLKRNRASDASLHPHVSASPMVASEADGWNPDDACLQDLDHSHKISSPRERSILGCCARRMQRLEPDWGIPIIPCHEPRPSVVENFKSCDRCLPYGNRQTCVGEKNGTWKPRGTRFPCMSETGSAIASQLGYIGEIQQLIDAMRYHLLPWSYGDTMTAWQRAISCRSSTLAWMPQRSRGDLVQRRGCCILLEGVWSCSSS